MPEKPKSIYESNGIREIREGQTARQCGPASDGVSILVPESIEQKIRMARSELAEKQMKLAGLEQERGRAFSVLQKIPESERDKKEQFFCMMKSNRRSNRFKGRLPLSLKCLKSWSRSVS